MIHSLFSAKIWLCIAIHWSGGRAVRPGCQKILSISIRRNPAILLNCFARVDFPDPPGPKIITRFMGKSHLSGVYVDCALSFAPATTPARECDGSRAVLWQPELWCN